MLDVNIEGDTAIAGSLEICSLDDACSWLEGFSGYEEIIV